MTSDRGYALKNFMLCVTAKLHLLHHVTFEKHDRHDKSDKILHVIEADVVFLSRGILGK